MDQTQQSDGSLLGDFKIWLNAPFSTGMSALHWFYFFGLLIFISVAWGFVLRHIYAGVEAL
jgi:hypothetical protein